MFEWFKRKTKLPPAYVNFYIVLGGTNGVEIQGITGLRLHEVPRETYNKHVGLKYWTSSAKKENEKSEDMLKEMGFRARVDILSVIYFKRPVKSNGICEENV